MDDDFDGGDSETFSIYSLFLSDLIDTIILKTNSRVINGNIILAISAKYERVFNNTKKIII
jgi:hypothetical protein